MKRSIDFNKKAFEYYMALYAVSGIRSTIITLVIGIADIFVLLPAFANPVQPIYMYIIVPPIAFLNVWAIWIVINPRKRQLQYTLFRGVFGIVCSVGLLVITQKFAYGMLGLQTPIYFVFSVGLYIFALNQYYKNHIRKLQGPIKKSKSSKKNSGFGVLAFVGLGQLIANISLGFATQKMVAIVLMCVYSMLSFMLFHFIMEFHRYYYLGKHIEDGGRTHETI